MVLAASCLVSAGCREPQPAIGDGGAGGLSGSGGWGAVGGSGGSAACASAPAIVSFVTDDGLKLEADDYPTGEGFGPSVVLLHMIPPSNDRTNFPQPFIDALLAKKIRVLAVDRRGAGASEGVAQDAYLGPSGKLDVVAAIRHLTSGDCGVDPLRIGVVGASNGTTTALDHAVYAAETPDEPFPSALVFMTGGTYTESQNVLGDHHADLDALPIQFVHSAAEGAWSKGYQQGAPAAWRFEELEPGDHGTKMFDARPDSIELVAGFLAEVL